MEKYNEEFYKKFLDYLEDTQPDFFWNDEYERFGINDNLYHWGLKNEVMGRSLTLKELVEDVTQYLEIKE